MIHQVSTELTVATRGRGMVEITGDVLGKVSESGIREGLLTVMVRHTSASLMIQENADPQVRRDMERFLGRLVPDGDPIFRHVSEGADDMPAHVRSAITATSLSIPIRGGRPVLGTWQGIYLCEHRARPHTRRVAIHLLGQ